MDILIKIDELTKRIAQEFNSFKSNIGNLSSLNTEDKSSLVKALIEIKAKLDNIKSTDFLRDSLNSSTSYTWSISKIKSYIDSIIEGLVSNVPEDHNTWKKLSDYLLNLEKELVNYVSYNEDIKSDEEQKQARENIKAASSVDISNIQSQIQKLKTDLGDLNRDFVDDFNKELL